MAREDQNAEVRSTRKSQVDDVVPSVLLGNDIPQGVPLETPTVAYRIPSHLLTG